MFSYFFPNPKTVEEFSINRNLSKIHSITEWDNMMKDNYKYYNGERFFKISRRFYKYRYTRGWIYGYYDNEENKEFHELEREIEREF